MKKYFFVRFAILFCAVLWFYTQSSAQNDTLYIKKLNIIPDTTVAGIQGISLLFSMDYRYDTAVFKNVPPGFFSLIVEVTANDKPVNAVFSTNAYKLENGHTGCDVFPNNRFVHSAFIHIPYYAMDLSEGQYNISLRFSAMFATTQTAAAEYYNVNVIYDDFESVSVQIPEKEYFSVLVNKAVAFDSDFDGRGWDYFLSDRLPPDMVWKIAALGNDRNDFFYSSSKERSSYTAEWTKYSSKICLSKGDVFYIVVVDNDPSYDDLIAYLDFTVDEIIDISAQHKALQSGKLSSIIISAKRLTR